MPALLTILGVFALILVLARLKAPLAAAILLGALAAGLLFGRPLGEVLLLAGRGLIQPMSLGLLTITVLQLVLSGAMQKGGQMQEIVSLARAVLRRPAVAMAAMPALIGLLPMPGGAVFSAPMVDSAAGEHNTDGAKLSAVNYWFRHIWEHWWPLYPGVILAMALSHTDWLPFALCQLPLGLIMVVAGLPILWRLHPQLRQSAPPAPAGSKRRLIVVTSSIWLIIVVTIPLAIAVRAAAPTSPSAILDTLITFGPITAGLVVAVAWTLYRGGLGARVAGALFASRSVASMGSLVLSVMAFQYVLKAVGAPGQVAQELSMMNAPVTVVVALLPFIAGMVTGLAFGFVGTSFPIVLPLAAVLAGEATIRPYVALAYAFGHLGQMCSPIHLCYVMSNRYFRTPFGPVYRHIVPSLIAGAAMTVGYFFVLRWLL